MTKIFGVFFRLPFEAKPFGVIETPQGIRSGIHPMMPSNTELIGVNISDYLISLDHGQFPSKIFDINVAKRMLYAKPRSDFKQNSEPWAGIMPVADVLLLKNFFPKIRAIEQNRYGSYQEWLQTLPDFWDVSLISAVKIVYEKVRLELEFENLLQTFEEIEMPLNRHFMISGSIGLGLELEKLDKRLAELDVQYYTSIRKLEIDYGYFVSGHEFTPKIESILSYLPDLTVNDFSKKYFWDSVESQMVLSPFLEALYEEHVTKRDLNELLRIRNSIGDTCKLIYNIYGTVSGRILITRPGVQYIKRSSRGIFAPRDGYKFIYADYAQFEPGILAFLSSDKVLVDIYNKGDVYSGLACIIGSGCERNVAKEIFLSFVYGMKRENIKRKIRLLYGELSSNNVDEFFNSTFGVSH